MAPLRASAIGDPGDGGQPSAAPPRRRRHWFARAVATIAVALFVSAAAGLAGGFFWFLQAVPNEEVMLNRSADGIVVLTGGDSRIADAIELLAEGRGKRLLISGVHKTTSSRAIARLLPRFEKLVTCCVDLDHSAVNTVGNAAETRRWVREQNFHSLIVVTSSYHMPRSMAELGRQLPDVELVAYPVVSERMRSEPWWSHPATARLLIAEYLKFMVAQVRMRLEPPPEKTALARTATEMH